MSDNESGEEDRIIGPEEYATNRAVLVARKVVRFVLSASESQNVVFGKTRLQTVAKDASQQENCPRIQFAQLLNQVNSILKDIYGYELVGLPPRQTSVARASPRKAGEDKIGSKASRFILLNIMPLLPELEELRSEQCSSLYKGFLFNRDHFEDNLNGIRTIESALETHQDLVFKGLLTVILSIILFSKNNILQQELFKLLESYGVPTDGTRIPVLDWTIDELMKSLDRKEYVLKLEENSEVEGDVTSYRIGRRTQLEFSIDALVEMVRQVLGLDDGLLARLKEDIKKNIGDSYT
ncbi:NSE3 (YDR288W) [Zygosaccharomyces parabailii]|uniref:ZYBA0S03-10968g1_1 n=1 Tax=Zygosaccharomyces bailii (strain CLIB 213 / ATCC 58445 / CBS 680 / BCRC 21525 / NBRC 1098 / NCYC 1416 / NRRL Y-2227) TaxID=1333698 RepID=A0A8J2T541_ZYGB2|nr:NSE3 (YDR288W) [Zygosaccharomyces parabailii]CDF89176.1 ZYBA0S03-10968g1_1 [Zygosaccharomyces bailii CLIB 213]CDH16268.1 related to Non-structural maintenance of chromosome element 3 [Zygosaccharomyces bailii ISA1307]